VEDVPRDNNGHQRSTAVNPNLAYDQRKQRDQHRWSVQSLDGMQEITTSPANAPAAASLWMGLARFPTRMGRGTALASGPGFTV
jgi:hypothetical protein